MTILYYGCTQEKEFLKEHNHNSKINIREISFKEALSLPSFSTAYQKVAKNKGGFNGTEVARTAFEIEFGFTIVEESPVRIITYDDGAVL